MGWFSFPRRARDEGFSEDPTDRFLVRRARQGDMAAYEKLVRRYQERIYSLVFRFVGNPEDAADLTQDTFVKAFQSLGSFQGNSSFYTWLYRIATNRALDFLRKRTPFPIESLSQEEFTRQDEPASARRDHDPERVAEAHELQRLVEEAIESLPEKLRAAIVLHDLEGLSQEETARVQECSVGTIKSRIFRARAELRKRLRSYVEA
ncbi:MAG: sigma-70 family RNA polymerase sigma factor [Armatimonadetes bacterium]|nr:sigma-70 family RNA polymerase sigma factor [Armatimonadota bacterium]